MSSTAFTLGSIAILGGVGNILTLWTLARDSTIATRLSLTVRSLMTVQAFVDACFCVVGLPLRITNLTLGHRATAELGAAFCVVAETCTFRMAKLSLWLLCAMAATRFAAVFTPLLYRRWECKREVAVVCAVIAVVASNGHMIVGLVAGWLVIKPLAGEWWCFNRKLTWVKLAETPASTVAILILINPRAKTRRHPAT